MRVLFDSLSGSLISIALDGLVGIGDRPPLLDTDDGN